MEEGDITEIESQAAPTSLRSWPTNISLPTKVDELLMEKSGGECYEQRLGQSSRKKYIYNECCPESE